MTRDDFREQVKILEIDSKAYDLDRRRPESYVLVTEHGTHKVGYSERGSVVGEQIFTDESAALKYLLVLLTKDQTTRLR